MKNEDIYIIFGFIGSIICSLMMIPQVYLTISLNKIEDLSIKFISMNLLAQLFFLPYSIYFMLYPLLLANISLSLCDLILITFYIKKYFYK